MVFLPRSAFQAVLPTLTALNSIILVPHVGIEPTTWCLQGNCSTNWANTAIFGTSDRTRTCIFHPVTLYGLEDRDDTEALFLFSGALFGFEPVQPTKWARLTVLHYGLKSMWKQNFQCSEEHFQQRNTRTHSSVCSSVFQFHHRISSRNTRSKLSKSDLISFISQLYTDSLILSTKIKNPGVLILGRFEIECF